MKYSLKLPIISTGLAVFAMFFGAGDLMYPLDVGIHSGNHLFWGMTGFLITTALLPLVGFVGMLLFNGNYQAFFERLGKPIGTLMVVMSMVIIGPGIALPRIITLTHHMLAPFLPPTLANTQPYSTFLFSLIFICITFALTFREQKIFTWLAYLVSPLLLASLAAIITKGFLAATTNDLPLTTSIHAFKIGFCRGYQTLDLLAAFFLASLVVSLLKNTLAKPIRNNPRILAHIGANAGLFGICLVGIMCIGMSLLGMYYGHGLEAAHPGELFKIIAFHIFDPRYALVTATAVIMACLSTAMALSAIVAEYVQREICQNTILFPIALALVLLASVPLATAGLSSVLQLTEGPIIHIGYPVLITLVVANIAYKLIGFKHVKTPVAIIFVLALIKYCL